MTAFNEDRFVRAICSRLDASIEHLDPELLQRLQQMRQAALAPQTESRRQHDHETLLKNVRASLQDTAALPPDIKLRLDAARNGAVARMRQRNTNPLQVMRSRIQYALSGLLDLSLLARPANMLATACVTITVVSLFYASSRPASVLPLEEEIVLIASADDFELYENLEFYLWLADNGLPN